ncbi:homeobox protein prophet of Pit-1-like [Pecten maximus]|uniref:homeobox protein prophet of Pit-1-like n=1 Tax=Pecten maximus TaxID=6579 RepID=UPI001457FDCF|nr:homeobox protein prophet of Pit-1-like [Pecten maximus]
MCSSQTDFSMRKILGIDGNQFSPVRLDLEQNSRKRKRRTRTIFSPQAVSILELAFSHNSYPDMYERAKLAGIIGEEEARVQVWFQNRRARAKRSRQAAIDSPPTDVSCDSLSSSISSGSASFSPVQRPVKPVPKAELDHHPSDIGPYHPFPYFYPASYIPAAVSIPRPFDYHSYHGDTLFGELKSPLWSPGSPTFSKLFEFPPKAHTPIADVNQRPVFPQHTLSDEDLSSRSSSVDSRQSAPDDITHVLKDRTVQYSCVGDLRRSERRSDDGGSQLVIGRIEDSSSDEEGGLVIDLRVRTPDSKMAAGRSGGY